MSDIGIKPRKKYILVKPDSEESRESEYGIVTPSNIEQEKKAVGEVVAIGDDVADLKVGDRVVFQTFAGDDLKIKEVEYKLLHDDEIIAYDVRT